MLALFRAYKADDRSYTRIYKRIVEGGKVRVLEIMFQSSE